ncbi:hypothetical protein AVEN_1903-1 [Araneus ventricosus]|uniref:Uncharacterized protein n=1 Tax=Araneus ventricosus TaxID=182803 RepID=A0A4Y2J3H1_ARAVE|nr:hypothetical protein AVEN_1903-1 [Araneus ventricosus]
MKFKRTGSVADASSGRPNTATDEGRSAQVLEAMARSPMKGNLSSLCSNGNQRKQCHAHFAGHRHPCKQQVGMARIPIKRIRLLSAQLVISHSRVMRIFRESGSHRSNKWHPYKV